MILPRVSSGPSALLVVGMAVALGACSSKASKPPARALVTLPSTNPFATLSARIPKDPELVPEAPAVQGTPRLVAFELERHAAPHSGWRLRVDADGAVWRSNLPKEIRDVPACFRVGHLSPAAIQQLNALSTFALVGVPKVGPKTCASCGTATAYVYWQPGVEKTRVVIARAGIETASPASESADTVAGWLLAIDRAAPKIDGDPLPLE
jgi:hypothetical protein